MRTCSYCGQVVDEGAYCSKCGRKFVDEIHSLDNNHTIDKVQDSNKVYPAEQLLDISKCGGIKSDGCLKSFRTMCRSINNNETLNSILQQLNVLATNSNQYATQENNTNLLNSVINDRIYRYLEFNERPLFYKDCAVMFYGKNGFLVTDKALYRIRKKGIKKILISDIYSIHLENVLGGKESCIWHFNNNYEFELDNVGTSAEEAGLIMTLICILFRSIKPDVKIQFYNYLKRCSKCYEYVNVGVFCPKCGHSIEDDIDNKDKITSRNSINGHNNDGEEEKADILDSILEVLDWFA